MTAPEPAGTLAVRALIRELRSAAPSVLSPAGAPHGGSISA
jgi:hypothetical protein